MEGVVWGGWESPQSGRGRLDWSSGGSTPSWLDESVREPLRLCEV